MPPVQFEAPELQGNESLKSFDSADSLGKAYVDLHSRVTAGDVSLINEDLRKDPSLASFKNVNDIAKSYVETKKLVGSIKKTPESPDGYKMTELKDLHPGLKNIPETQKVMAKIFHEAGLHNEAADIVQQRILTLLSGSLQKQDEARTAKGKEVETALRADWKEGYDKNKDAIEKILVRAGAPELAKSISGDPVALKAVHKIVSLLSEDSIGKMGDSGSQNITEKGEAAKEIQKMIGEQWHLKKGKEYEDGAAKWNRLHEIAYGGV